MNDAELRFIDILRINHYSEVLSGLEEDGFIILSSGGTLNCVNDTEGIDFNNDILYYPSGTGNDFAHDIGQEKECGPFPITEYLKDLPIVEINGKNTDFSTASVMVSTVIAAKWVTG